MPIIDSNGNEHVYAQLVGDNDFSRLASAKKSNGEVQYNAREAMSIRVPLPLSAQAPVIKAPSIKWMGSSYSGSDIEVIAHIYDAPDIGNKIKTLESALADIIQEQVDLVRAEDNLASELFSKEYLSLDKVKIEKEEHLKEFRYLRDNGQTTVKLGTLQTISTQTYRHKFAVRALGHSYPKGYVRGTRTIAGSMIFTLFDEHALSKLIFAMSKSDYMKAMDENISTFLPDQLPPIDLTLAFINEYGSMSRLNIYGAEFLSDSLVFSVEDILSENVLSFVARDIDVFTKIGNKPLLDNGKDFEREANVSSNRASRLIDNTEYKSYLTKLGLRNNRTNR